MKTQQYQLRISGLRSGKGQIRAATLQRILDALLATAERATRLLATGTGGTKGARPQWLDATLAVTITGMEPGSTILGMEAPQLRETAEVQFAQMDLWAKQPGLEATVLDLAAQAINETQMQNSVGDYFDSSVLEAILKFRKAAGTAGVSYEMNPRGTAQGKFVLDDSKCALVRERLDRIPVPRSFVVSGRLDEIKHGSGRFRLLMNRGTPLFGRLDTSSLSVEALRPLWGKQTTLAGMVHFKANGQPRWIEARRISSRVEGDNVFEEVPSLRGQDPQKLFPVRSVRTGNFDPMVLAGAWPGNEPTEDLLAQLD
ncbi:MAG: hypothetical protein OXP66_11850 [Candidatus Tectomicrobia bacterium]|nr:hypothetical protein [Candidatus Tectomicrobia bacterium]